MESGDIGITSALICEIMSKLKLEMSCNHYLSVCISINNITIHINTYNVQVNIFTFFNKKKIKVNFLVLAKFMKLID